MSSERTGLILRGQLLKVGSREVTPKGSDAFTVYEARLLSEARIHIVTFYDQNEMVGALRSYKIGQVIEVPVYGRARNNNVHLHFDRSEPQPADGSAAKAAA
jgi:hypothetical protein